MKTSNQTRTAWTTPEMVSYGDVETLTAKGAGGGDGISMHSGLEASQGDDNDFS